MDSNSPIGVFDSGLGGLTVLKELRRLLPHENFIFVGDSARAPYGSRTPEEIISFLQQFMDYFQSRGVKMAVCACNTMTSYGYPVIKDKTSFALVPMNQLSFLLLKLLQINILVLSLQKLPSKKACINKPLLTLIHI